MKIRKIVLYALVAGIYVVVALIMGPFAFGPIQFRLSEILMVLCCMDKGFIIPLTIGCFLSNLIGAILGYNLIALDILFGTIGTLISGILMYKFKEKKLFKKPVLSLVMPCAINGIIIGAEYILYGISINEEISFLLFLYTFITVFLGEFICLMFFGFSLYDAIENIVNKEKAKMGL